MTPVIVWTVVALVVAAVVMVVAGGLSGRAGGVRQFVTDLDAGLRSLLVRDEDARRQRRALRDDDEEEDGTLAELFTVGTPQSTDYLTTEELAAPFARASERLRAGRR